MINNVSNRVRIIAITLFILSLSKNFTIGFNKIAMIRAKIIGTIMPCAIYNIVNRADKPTKKMPAFT